LATDTALYGMKLAYEKIYKMYIVYVLMHIVEIFKKKHSTFQIVAGIAKIKITHRITKNKLTLYYEDV